MIWNSCALRIIVLREHPALWLRCRQHDFYHGSSRAFIKARWAWQQSVCPYRGFRRRQAKSGSVAAYGVLRVESSSNEMSHFGTLWVEHALLYPLFVTVENVVTLIHRGNRSCWNFWDIWSIAVEFRSSIWPQRSIRQISLGSSRILLTNFTGILEDPIDISPSLSLSLFLSLFLSPYLSFTYSTLIWKWSCFQIYVTFTYFLDSIIMARILLPFSSVLKCVLIPRSHEDPWGSFWPIS